MGWSAAVHRAHSTMARCRMPIYHGKQEVYISRRKRKRERRCPQSPDAALLVEDEPIEGAA